MKHPTPLQPVPQWFLDEMRGVDSMLAVRWNERSQRWQIMRRRQTGEVPSALALKDITEREWHQYVHCFTVENPDGSFRALDMRLIHALRKGDMQRRDWRQVLAEIEREEEELERDRNRYGQSVKESMLGEMRHALNERSFSGPYAGGKITM